MPLRIVPSHSVPARPAPAPRGAPRPTPGSRPAPAPPSAARGYPILLSDVVTVQSGGEANFESRKFTNLFSAGIELHSLRVTINMGAGAVLLNGGGLVALAIFFDGVPMTHGPIAAWCLAPSLNRASDMFLMSAVASYVWRFETPAYLRPNGKIEVIAKHTGGSALDATVGIGFAGRAGVSPSGSRRVPYAAAWSSKSFGYAEVGSDSTPPASLVNDTKRDLRVERIIGRAAAFDDASGAGTSFTDFSDVSMQAVSSFLVRLGVSSSRPVMKNYVPFRTAFGEPGAIETDFILRPGDYLKGDVKHLAGPALGTPFAYSQNHVDLSIVGSREA